MNTKSGLCSSHHLRLHPAIQCLPCHTEDTLALPCDLNPESPATLCSASLFYVPSPGLCVLGWHRRPESY